MRGTRPLIVIVSLGSVLVAPAAMFTASAAAEGSWGPVVNVSGRAPDVWDVDLADSGRVTVVAWVRWDGHRTRLLTAAKHGDGEWGRPRPVPGSRGAGEVEVALAEGGTTVAWTAGRRVLEARRGAGDDWTAPVALHRTPAGVRGTRPGSLQLAMNHHGRALVAWETVDDDMDGVYATQRVQGAIGTRAGRWGKAKTFSARGYEAAGPEAVVARNGRTSIVWSEHRGRVRRVMTTSREVDRAWSPPRALSAPSTRPGLPHLAALPSGRLAVAWSVFDKGLRVVRWRARGGWTKVLAVPKADVRVSWTDIGIRRTGGVTLAWTNDAKSVWTASQRPGGRWHFARVSPVGSVYYGMEVAMNRAGDSVVTWLSQRGTGADVHVAVAYRAGSGAWMPATVLSARRTDAWGPSVAIEGDGDVSAAWSLGRGDRRGARVQARHYTAR